MSGDRKDADPASESGGLSSEARELAFTELKFHHDRIAAGSDVVTSIGNYIFILFGAGAVAATHVPEAIVIVPLFWSAWLLHAMQRARDTIKHEVLARHLEQRINQSLKTTVLVWNTALTTGAMGTSKITIFNGVYWMLLNLASWVLSVYVVWDEGHKWWAVAIAALGVLVYLVCALTERTRGRFYEECDVLATKAFG